MTHCEEHSGVCANMTNLSSQIGDLSRRMDAHCANGGTGHVSRLELKTLQEDVSTLTTAVREVVREVAEMKTAEKVQQAGLSRGDKLLLAVLATLGPLAAAAITLLK